MLVTSLSVRKLRFLSREEAKHGRHEEKQDQGDKREGIRSKTRERSNKAEAEQGKHEEQQDQSDNCMPPTPAKEAARSGHRFEDRGSSGSNVKASKGSNMNKG